MSGKEKKKGEQAILALADGTVFRGEAIGAEGMTVGEVVFNTSMSGYQEIVTDPSYNNQIITFTYPHIGNVGVNDEDVESERVQVSGVIVRELSTHFSNHRSQYSFGEYLKRNNVVGISGIDTRALVLHLRTHGAQMGVIASGKHSESDLIERARTAPSMDGLDLVPNVTVKNPYDWSQGTWQPGTGFTETGTADVSKRPLVVAIDFGIKYNILRLLVDQGFRVKVVPAMAPAEEILKFDPAGVFLSNGPGDPAAVRYGIRTVQDLLGKRPMFGICLGHQIMGLALGANTFKLKFGHRGANHPVRDEVSRKIEITVQNHGFAVDGKAIPSGMRVTHLNLNDQTVEGLEMEDGSAFAVQYHPESSPGPHDATIHFRRFRELVERHQRKGTK